VDNFTGYQHKVDGYPDNPTPGLIPFVKNSPGLHSAENGGPPESDFTICVTPRRAQKQPEPVKQLHRYTLTGLATGRCLIP
jgi:hypothetical protein